MRSQYIVGWVDEEDSAHRSYGVVKVVERRDDNWRRHHEGIYTDA